MDDNRIDSEEEWFSLVMDAADMVLWDRDLATNRVRTSANYAQFYGLEDGQREWSFQTFLECVAVEDRALVQEYFDAALGGRSDYNFQFRIIGRDRELRWCEARGRIHRRADGTATRVTGVTWDITRQRASEERLTHIAKLVPGMVYQFERAADGAYRFPYCSDGIGALFGLAPADVRDDASALLKLVHPADLRVLLDALEMSARTMTQWHCEYRVRPENGEERWISGTANPERKPDGAVLWHGHTKDITQAKHAELAMGEVNARLALALSAAHMMTWYWDLASDAFVSSPAIGPILGREDRAYTMSELFTLMPAADAARMRTQCERVAREAVTQPVIIEFNIALPDGHTRLIESQARCALDANGRSTTVIGVALDISRRRKLEKEREDLLLHLADTQKIETIGMLTGGIAHDFNNVLSSILGYSSLALDRYAGQLPDKLVDYLDEIQQAGERGRDMVVQLLAFGRGEHPQVRPTDLNGLVTQTLKMVRATLPTSIELATEVAVDLPPATTHPTQFQQVLLNLCINARDAMQGAGQIHVTLHEVMLEELPCASCGKHFAGRHLLLSVIDAGPGIPDNIRGRIFDPFFSTKVSRGGTGMGLAMVHSLVHSHGGHIVVETSAHSGTAFKLYFKVDTEREVAPAPHGEARRALPICAPLRVLVVDDESAVGRFFAEMLMAHGHFADVECEPLRAWARFSAAPDDYDLIITDQIMPRMSGVELAQRVLALRPALPIILVSGYSADLDASTVAALGVRRFLHKPISAEHLLKAIDEAVQHTP